MLNAVICGAGQRGLEHAEAIEKNQDLELKGFFDISLEARRNAEQSTSRRTYSSLETLINEHSAEIVVVATPPHVRLNIIKKITKCDSVRAILIEKPLALTLTEANEILAVCRKRNLMALVVHQLRYSPEFIRLKETLQSAKIGKVKSLEAYCYGNLFNQGSHMVDMIRWLQDFKKVEWVTAQSSTDLPQLAKVIDIPADFREDLEHPGPLWLQATLGFEGEIQASLSSGLLTQIAQPQLGPWLQKRIVVVGDQGTAEAHVASHFKLLNSDHPEGLIEKTGVQSYQGATENIYANLVVQLQSPESNDYSGLEEEIQTLEVMLACLHSANIGSRVTLPLPKDIDPLSQIAQSKEGSPENNLTGSSNQSDTKPVVSVILPMGDHRGLGIESIASWMEQRCAPEDFEMILITDKDTQGLEETFKKLLRPFDQIIHYPASNEMEQYDIGAKLSKGRYLFFTEPHCLPEPETISEIIHFFRTQPFDGLCARTIPIAPSQISKMEARMYDEGFAEWSQPGHWAKVILRGFGIRREVYLEVGGFNFRYDRFSEWLLAAELKQKGYQLAYAPGVGLKHLYSNNFGLLDRFIKDFTDGESFYRREGSKEFVMQYFGAPAEWHEVNSVDRVLSLTLIKTLWKQKGLFKFGSNSWRKWKNTIKQFLYLLPMVIFGQKLLGYKYHNYVRWAKLRYYIWLGLRNENNRYKAFFQWYMNTVSFYRVKFVINNIARRKEASEAKLHYSVEKIQDHDIFGFHEVENFQGELFRWTSSISALRVNLEPEDYQVTIQTNNARHFSPEEELSIYLDNNLLTDVTFDSLGPCLKFNLPKELLLESDSHWLILNCLPWNDRKVHMTEQRTLGIPIVSINFE